MSQLIRTGPLSPHDDAEEVDRSLGVSPWDVLDQVWRTFTSMRTALVLILALAILALVGTLVVQAPAGLQSDAEDYAAWLDSLRPKYGGWVPVLDRLQFLAVFQSIWFKAILVGLTTSILACSVNRFRGLWRIAVHPRTKMTGTFYDRAPHSETLAVDVAHMAAVEVTGHVLASRRYRTVIEADGDVVHVYADRFRWAPFGTQIAHLSLVLILIGALVGSAFGFRNNELAVTVGSTADVGGGTGLTVMARRFSDTYNTANGAPSDYASDLVLYRNGTEVAHQTIRVNEPMSFEGIGFYQSFFGPAALVQVADTEGKVLYEAGVPLLWASNDGKRRIGQFALTNAGVTVFVIGPASGRVDPTIKAGQIQLELYPSGSERPSAIEVVSQGEPATIGDLKFTFEREQQFTGLIVARDPGVVFVWLGSILLVVGLFLVFLFPNRRIWLAIREGSEGRAEVRLAATARHDATFGPDFQKLVNDLRLAFGRGAN